MHLVGKIIVISYPTSLLSVTSFQGLALEGDVQERRDCWSLRVFGSSTWNPCVSTGGV